MRNTEKYLPVILSLLFPAMNIISQNQVSDNIPLQVALQAYLLSSLYLYSLWHLNRLYTQTYEYRWLNWLGPLPTVIILNVFLIATFVSLNKVLLPDEVINQLLKAPFLFLMFRLVIASTVFILIQRALNAIKQREAYRVQNLSLQAENLKSQLEAMKQQINPHFLFNSLNSLLDLIEEDQEKATEFVRSFSNLYRVVLQSSQQDFITVQDEIRFLEDYWHLIKIRFNKAVDMVIDVPELKMHDWIPPLSLQLLVENAVKHNVATPREPLVINIGVIGNVMIISNKVNPKEFDVQSEGVGLSNLQKRFSLLLEPITYGNEAGSFVVKLPLKSA